MKIKKRPSMRTLMRHVEAGSDSGYCTRCWTLHHGIEPDAKSYYCANCGARAVYGCEELILMQEANEI